MRKPRKERRFLFTSFAVGFNGLMKSLKEERIEGQAVSALPVGGGLSTSRVENVGCEEFVSIKSLESFAAGRKVLHPDGSGTRIAQSTASATLNGFNMLNVFRAGYVSSRVAVDYPDNGEDPEITTLGTGFDDLWIAGRRVEIEYHEALYGLKKFSDLARKENVEAVKLLSDCWTADRADRKAMDKPDSAGDNPGRGLKFDGLAKYDKNLVRERMKALRVAGPIAVSIVKQVHGLPSGVEVEPYPRQHVLHVPGFGEINLGETIFTPTSRRLTMMRFDLGCTHGGCGCSGDVCGDGSWHP